MNVRPTPPIAESVPSLPAAAVGRVGPVEQKVFGGDGFTFGDVLDVVNPLQHIPVVDTLYRDWAGDEIAHGPRVLGDGLFGLGLLGTGLGLIGTFANVISEEWTGKDLGEHVLGWIRGDGGAEGEGPVLAPGEREPDDGALPEYLEIARVTDREVERIDSAAPAGAVRAREELRTARDEVPSRMREFELARALVAYRSANANDPWVRLADQVR